MYNGSTINLSPTSSGVAGAEIKGGPFTAVIFKNGAVVQAEAGEPAMGILLAESDDILTAGDEVNFQIAGCGRWKAGAPFEAGDPLTSDENGCAVKATGGAFIVAFAMEAANAAGEHTLVQITKSGFYNPAEAPEEVPEEPAEEVPETEPNAGE